MLDQQVVLITLIVYKIVLIVIGFWAQRKISSEQDFFLAGRQLGPWVAAISYSASAASAWTLLGMSGLAYALGLPALWVALGAVMGCAFSWWVIAPKVMTLGASQQLLSATELVALGSEGNNRVNIIRLVSFIILLCFVVYIASQFQGAGDTFATAVWRRRAREEALLPAVRPRWQNVAVV